jgi:hypothetical protein
MTEHAPVFTLSPLDGAQPTQVKLYSIKPECDADSVQVAAFAQRKPPSAKR